MMPQQQNTLSFIRDYLHTHGHAPTLEEIGAAVGVRSKGAVHRLVQAWWTRDNLTPNRAHGHVHQGGGGANACREFIYGGCGGVTPFGTLEACRRMCEE